MTVLISSAVIIAEVPGLNIYSVPKRTRRSTYPRSRSPTLHILTVTHGLDTFAICLTFPNPAMKTQSSLRFAATFLKLPYSADSLFSKNPMRYRFLD